MEMVEQFGVFVDAGYLFAAAGQLCCGTTDRSLLVLDTRSIAEGLVSHGSANCALQHLRTYWYDGAPDAHPTAQHLDIANLPGVKLRLGRLVKGRQKGVDSRIVRDLIILSQERAISVAYLLGGDEDLREGVSEAQERGVRVVLMAIEPLNQQNLSPTLAMEVDAITVFGREFFGADVSLRIPAAEPSEVQPAGAIAHADPASIGREFGAEWLAQAPLAEIEGLRRGRPRIPSELDRNLLMRATQMLGRRHLAQEEARGARSGFWQAVLTEVSPSASP